MKLSAILTLLLCSISIAQTTQPLDSLLKEIDRRAGEIKDLTADFEQEKQSPLLKKPLVSKGVVRAKGAAMLWDTASPHPTRMRVDGESLQLLYVDQKVLEIFPLQGKLAQLAASPLPRLKVLQDQFKIEGGQASEGVQTFILTPTDAKLAEHVDQVIVAIDTRTAVISRFQLTDPDGEKTVIRFSNHKLNTDLPDAALQINAPEGTKTVRPLDGAQNMAP